MIIESKPSRNPPHGGGSEALDTLSRRAGVQRRYVDGTGVHRTASDDAVIAVLRAMGFRLRRPDEAPGEFERLAAADRTRLCEPVCVLWVGSPPIVRLGPAAGTTGRLELEWTDEHGDARAWKTEQDGLVGLGGGGLGVLLPFVPPAGFHRLRITAGSGSQESLVLAAPPRCYEPDEKTGSLGAFLPLHAVRSDSNLGLGDYTDLARLGRWAERQGCRYLGTLPLLTTLLDGPFEPSPYVPASRSVFGELFIDAHAAARDHPLPSLRRLLDDPSFGQAAERRRRGELVDYAGSWRLVRRCLEAAAADVAESESLRTQVDAFAAKDPLLRDYARFRGTLPGDAKSKQAEEKLFMVAQWLLHAQLGRAASALGDAGGLYLDLPIGSHPQGFDAWRQPDLYARGASLGAPPDDLFRHGQSWGFPPVIPGASRASGHREFSQAIGRHLTHGSALRIDHAAGLFRCFWVPDGCSAADGVYVRQPAEELLALLSIHSHRHRAVIVAEDLGTVPRRISRGLERRGLLNMDILQFTLGDADRPLPQPRSRSLVALNTHDMPPFAAFWTGADIPLHARIGVVTEDQIEELQEQRAAMRERVLGALREAGLIDNTDPDPETIATILLAHAAEEAAGILLVSIEDLWGETEPQNVPGIAEGYPNWRRRASPTLDEIEQNPRVAAALSRLNAAAAETHRS